MGTSLKQVEHSRKRRSWVHALQPNLHPSTCFFHRVVQQLEVESPLLISRPTLAYSQCLTVLWNYPEVWADILVVGHQYLSLTQLPGMQVF